MQWIYALFMVLLFFSVSFGQAVGVGDEEMERIKYLKPVNSQYTDEIHFLDDKGNLRKVIGLWELNPYNKLVYPVDTTAKIHGRIGYRFEGLSLGEKARFSHILQLQDSVSPEEIVSAGVSTLVYPFVRNYALVEYVIRIYGREKILAAQTTLIAFDKYGSQIGKIIENELGGANFAITSKGSYIVNFYGGRYGCGSGDYIPSSLKVYDTATGKVLYEESINSDVFKGVRRPNEDEIIVVTTRVKNKRVEYRALDIEKGVLYKKVYDRSSRPGGREFSRYGVLGISYKCEGFVKYKIGTKE